MTPYSPPKWVLTLRYLVHAGIHPIPWPGAQVVDIVTGHRMICLGRVDPDGEGVYLLSASETPRGVTHPLNYLGDPGGPFYHPLTPEPTPTDTVVLDLEHPETRQGFDRRLFERVEAHALAREDALAGMSPGAPSAERPHVVSVFRPMLDRARSTLIGWSLWGEDPGARSVGTQHYFPTRDVPLPQSPPDREALLWEESLRIRARWWRESSPRPTSSPVLPTSKENA